MLIIKVINKVSVTIKNGCIAILKKKYAFNNIASNF